MEAGKQLDEMAGIVEAILTKEVNMSKKTKQSLFFCNNICSLLESWTGITHMLVEFWYITKRHKTKRPNYKTSRKIAS